MNNTAAIVVTFNRKQLLVKNIESLLSQKNSDLDIIIIDNASTDGTREYIEKYIASGQVRYINTEKNIGGAGGFNLGIKTAVSDGYEYIWIMDDDTICHEDTLSQLIDAGKELGGKYGFLSSVAIWKDGSICNMNRQKGPDGKYTDSELLSGKLLRTNYATFVSMFFRADVIRDIGLPIKEFFIWGDDVEYTNRISKKYDCYVAGKSRVLHDTANNAGSNIADDDIARVERYRYAYRNEVYIAKRNGLKGICRQIAKVGLHILRVLVSKKGHKFKKWGIILGSSIKGISFNPKVEYTEE